MPIDKLTLDAKNELSIDPLIGGITEEDELHITKFCAREAWIWTTVWSNSDATDHSLFFTKVSPNMCNVDTTGPTDIVWNTPMGHVNQLFTYWRGDIVFRFKFICSQYHRGRVRINWDPHGDIGTTGDYTTETYTKVVDISEETDVEFCVPYTQSLAYLKTYNTLARVFTDSSTSTSDVGVYFNGILTVRVLTKQTSPITSADIRMLVFVRGAENLEFACPQDVNNTLSPYAVQSRSMKKFDEQVSCDQIGIASSKASGNINLVYHGETVKSLRQLMRRQVLYKRLVPASSSAADTIYLSKFRLARAPLYPGFDPAGVDLALGIVSGLSAPINIVNWSPITWIGQCFIGTRGSYVYTVNPNGQMNCKLVSISRDRTSHTSSVAVQSHTYSGNGALKQSIQTTQDAGLAGLTITNQTTQAGLTALLPMYANVKFQMNSASTRTNGSSTDDTADDSLTIHTTYQTETNSYNDFFVDLYVGAGTDLTFNFFLNVPALYNYNAYPTPLP
jgi:hypothetical protein